MAFSLAAVGGRRLGRPAWFISLLLTLVLVAAPAGCAAAPAPAPQETGGDILQFLTRAIEWYRQVNSLDAAQNTPEEVVFRDTLQRNSREVVRLAFAFARARADILARDEARRGPATAPSATTGQGGTNLAQASAAAAQHIAELQAQLDELNRQIPTTAPSSVEALTARRDKVAAELNLATARRDVLQNLAGFASGVNSGGAAGLLAKVDELERSVPGISDADPAAPSADAAAVKAPASPSPSALSSSSAAEPFRPESAGVLGLVTQVFSLSGRMSEVRNLSQRTKDLTDENDRFRQPIRAELVDALHRGAAIEQRVNGDDPSRTQQDRQELDALVQRFKLLAAAGVPLRNQSLLLDASRTTFDEWQRSIERESGRVLRHLLVRLIVMGVAIAVLVIVSEVWRRATFRYVADVRRRRQFLTLRRIVVGCVVLVIVVAGFVTEFGSLATFAGLITAGIAVALQTVIVSGVAYFFFIGRYGVRAGDRVTIAGVTGDVIDVGLFRLYLMELGGSQLDLRPTGRIVVFSNSVLFQPSAFFKQIPGADFVWHEVAVTLAPDSDYQAAERKLLGAVESVYNEYRETIEHQRAAVNRTMHYTMAEPKPEGRVRFVDKGLEAVVRYPVEIRRATEIDDRITKLIVDVIAREPSLRLAASSGMPKVRATT